MEQELNRVIPKELRPLRITGDYGQGVQSKIYKAVLKDGTILALKVSKEEHKVGVEEQIQQTIVQYDMAPKIYATGELGVKSFVVMDPISVDLNRYIDAGKFNISHLIHAVKCLLDKKYVLQMLHGDMHTENIVILMDGISLGFIDFDYTIININPIYTILDFIPFLGSLKLSPFGKTNDGKTLINYILQYYKDNFNMTINMAKLKEGTGGGYVYDGKLNSYMLRSSKIGMHRTTLQDIESSFPDLKMPKIV